MTKKVWLQMASAAACVVLGIIFIAATAWGVLLWRGYNITVGRCLVTGGGEYLLIDEETPIILGGDTASCQKFSTGDRILVIYNFVEESYPAYTAPLYCVRLSRGTTEDVPASVRETLTELGWYAEPTAAVSVDVNAQYIRTNGYQEGFKGPQTAVIRSEEELNEYIEEKRRIWNLESQAFRYAVWEYDEEYFKTGQLVMILQQEPSGFIGAQRFECNGGGNHAARKLRASCAGKRNG